MLAARKEPDLTLERFMIYRSRFLPRTEKKFFLKLHRETLESPKELNNSGCLRLVVFI